MQSVRLGTSAHQGVPRRALHAHARSRTLDRPREGPHHVQTRAALGLDEGPHVPCHVHRVPCCDGGACVVQERGSGGEARPECWLAPHPLSCASPDKLRSSERGVLGACCGPHNRPLPQKSRSSPLAKVNSAAPLSLAPERSTAKSLGLTSCTYPPASALASPRFRLKLEG